jgi:hypothetical protein
MLISCDVNTNIVNGGSTCTHSWSLHEDWLRKTWPGYPVRGVSLGADKRMFNKFMSAPVDAAIAAELATRTSLI